MYLIALAVGQSKKNTMDNVKFGDVVTKDERLGNLEYRKPTWGMLWTAVVLAFGLGVFVQALVISFLMF